jgi:4-carboxymuconolactone decarboxylase
MKTVAMLPDGDRKGQDAVIPHVTYAELSILLRQLSSPRFPRIAMEDMYYEQRRVAQAIAARRKASASSNGGLEGPFVPLAYVPGILDRLQALGEHCRFYTGVPAKLREMAICITAYHIRAAVEFFVHAIEAREFGLAEDKLEALADGRRPENMDDEEALVYDFTLALHQDGRVSDELFARAEKQFGKATILDLIATCGYYATLGMVLNVTRTALPDGVPLPFAVSAD